MELTCFALVPFINICIIYNTILLIYIIIFKRCNITTCTNTIYYAIYYDICAINIIYAINISYHHTDIKILEANPKA